MRLSDSFDKDRVFDGENFHRIVWQEYSEKKKFFGELATSSPPLGREAQQDK